MKNDNPDSHKRVRGFFVYECLNFVGVETNSVIQDS